MIKLIMEKKELIDKLASAVMEYIADEELYDDNARLVVNPATGEVRLIDGDEDVDDDSLDVYDVMDMVRMNADGVWEPDTEAIAELIG